MLKYVITGMRPEIQAYIHNTVQRMVNLLIPCSLRVSWLRHFNCNMSLSGQISVQSSKCFWQKLTLAMAFFFIIYRDIHAQEMFEHVPKCCSRTSRCLKTQFSRTHAQNVSLLTLLSRLFTFTTFEPSLRTSSL